MINLNSIPTSLGVVKKINITLFNLGVVPPARGSGVNLCKLTILHGYDHPEVDMRNTVYRMPTGDGCPTLHCTGLYPSTW